MSWFPSPLSSGANADITDVMQCAVTSTVSQSGATVQPRTYSSIVYCTLQFTAGNRFPMY